MSTAFYRPSHGPVTNQKIDLPAGICTRLGFREAHIPLQKFGTGAVPLAKSNTRIVTTGDFGTPVANAQTNVSTISAQPDVCRTLSLTTTNFSSNVLYITVYGTNYWGETIKASTSCTATVTAQAFDTPWAFATVSGYSYYFTGATAGRTVAIGDTSTLGLPAKIAATGDILGLRMDTTGSPPGTADTTSGISTTYWTWLPATIPDGTCAYYVSLQSTYGLTAGGQ